MLTQFFFLMGLAAVAFFFLGITLLGMSLFAATAAGRRRLTRAQSIALLVLLLLTAWTAWRLHQGLLPWTAAAPPTASSALIAAQRECMTVMLLGLAVVVNALLTAFAWVRIGLSGNALRAVLWALPGLRLVLGCKDLLGALQTPGAEGFAGTFDAWTSSLLVITAVCAGLALLSWPAGWMLRRSAARGHAERA